MRMRACSVTGGVLIAVVSLTAPFKSHDLTYNVKIGIRTFSGEKNELRSAAESGKPDAEFVPGCLYERGIGESQESRSRRTNRDDKERRIARRLSWYERF